jgi:hypothetical protein
LAVFNIYRGRLDEAEKASADLFRIARELDNPEIMLQAHHCAWPVRWHRGRFAQALAHADTGLGLYEEERYAHHRHLYFGRSQQIIAQRQASAAETSTAAVETPLGSTVGPSIDATPPPEPTGSQQVVAQPQSIADEASAAVGKTPLGSPRGPSTDETPPPEPSGSQQVIPQPQSIADEASAAQHAPGATMPWVATSDGEPDQTSQNFEIQSNHHATLDGGSVAFTPESRFPETQVKESAGFFGSTASAGANPPLLDAASRGRRAVKANRDKIADQLNHAELSRLRGGGRASRQAPRR